MTFHPQYLLIATIACIASMLSVGWLAKRLRRLGKCDAPNARSSHSAPTPAGGGVGIAIGMAAGLCAAGLLFEMAPPPWVILLGSATMVLVGAADDWTGGLPAGRRLALQAAAAALVVGVTGPIVRFPLPAPADVAVGWLGYPLSIFWIVGVANVYNFLDGIDGFAGMQGALAGLALIVLPLDPSFAVAGWCLAGACLGFLRHNWSPAAIFMGDSGSLAIGFLLATMPFSAPEAARGEVIFWMALALWFFLSDGAYTLLRRIARGERFWEPHRMHLQRLVQRGYGTTRSRCASGWAR